MRTARQALADVAKLCDEDRIATPYDARRLCADVHVILADVAPAPAPGWSEGESAVQALRDLGYVKSTDHVTGSVQWFLPRPTPAACSFDIERAGEVLRRWRDSSDYDEFSDGQMIDLFAACVVPAPAGGTVDRQAAS